MRSPKTKKTAFRTDPICCQDFRKVPRRWSCSAALRQTTPVFTSLTYSLSLAHLSTSAMVAGVRVGGGRRKRVVGDVGDALNQMVALPMVGRSRRRQLLGYRHRRFRLQCRGACVHSRPVGSARPCFRGVCGVVAPFHVQGLASVALHQKSRMRVKRVEDCLADDKALCSVGGGCNRACLFRVKG